MLHNEGLSVVFTLICTKSLKWCWVWTVESRSWCEDLSTEPHSPLGSPQAVKQAHVNSQIKNHCCILSYLASNILQMYITFPHVFLCPNPCINWTVRTILLPHILTRFLDVPCVARWVVDTMPNTFQPQQLSCRTNLGAGKLSGFWGGFGASLGWAESTSQPENLFLLHIHGIISNSILAWEWAWAAPPRSKGEVVMSCFITTPLPRQSGFTRGDVQ